MDLIITKSLVSTLITLYRNLKSDRVLNLKINSRVWDLRIYKLNVDSSRWGKEIGRDIGQKQL